MFLQKPQQSVYDVGICLHSAEDKDEITFNIIVEKKSCTSVTNSGQNIFPSGHYCLSLDRSIYKVSTPFA